MVEQKVVDASLRRGECRQQRARSLQSAVAARSVDCEEVRHRGQRHNHAAAAALARRMSADGRAWRGRHAASLRAGTHTQVCPAPLPTLRCRQAGERACLAGSDLDLCLRSQPRPAAQPVEHAA